MLNVNLTKYTYKDIAILPAAISEISSRKECIPFNSDGYYPLFTAPMTSVIDEPSSNIFEENKIHSILPRSVKFEKRLEYGRNTKRWIAVSLKEFQETFLVYSDLNNGMKVLIDVANGHMAVLYETIKSAKKIYGNQLTIMVGNIANPKTYIYAINAGADAVRCGIGAGNGCFVGETLVRLSNGETTRIDSIANGDFVKTVKGSREVLSVKHEKAKELIKINDAITCTPNHKFLVIKKDDKDKVSEENLMSYAFYVDASKLNNDMLLVKNEILT